jgi:hypothetical protein
MIEVTARPISRAMDSLREQKKSQRDSVKLRLVVVKSLSLSDTSVAGRTAEEPGQSDRRIRTTGGGVWLGVSAGFKH